MMVLRPAQILDIPRLIEGNLALAAESEGLLLHSGPLREGLQAVLHNPCLGTYRVAVEDERVIGQVLTTPEWSDWRNRMYWWIQSVYVWPEARSRGVFRALYARVREEALEAGIAGLRLYVDTRNTAAMEVYRRIGMNGDHYRVFEEDFERG